MEKASMAITKFAPRVGHYLGGYTKAYSGLKPIIANLAPLVNDTNYSLLPHDDIRDIYVDTSEHLDSYHTPLTQISPHPVFLKATTNMFG